jgi:hypothetical protein
MLGMRVQTDLTHSGTALKTSTDGSGIAQEASRLLERIRYFQDSSYNFSVIGFLRDFLYTLDFDESQQSSTEDAMYKYGGRLPARSALCPMQAAHAYCMGCAAAPHRLSLELEPRRGSDESPEPTESAFRLKNSKVGGVGVGGRVPLFITPVP